MLKNYFWIISGKARLNIISFLLILFFTVIISCKKDPPLTTTGGVPNQVKIHLKHLVDNNPIAYDTIQFVNAAGNHFSVERLNYYLSNITFNTSDGRQFIDHNVHYVDGRDSTTLTITISNPGTGHVVSFSALLGVPSERDTFGLLPNTMANQNMFWPENLGGGYHFMKMEGSFTSGITSYGYAMHLGKPGFQSLLQGNAEIYLNGVSHELDFNMNMNEIFKNPYTYDLDLDGNYTMGDTLWMRRISNNDCDMCSIILTR